MHDDSIINEIIDSLDMTDIKFTNISLICEKEELLRQAKFPLILEVTADAAWKIEFEKID